MKIIDIEPHLLELFEMSSGSVLACK